MPASAQLAATGSVMAGSTSQAIDPLGPAFPDRLAGLLHADDLLLGSKLRDHGKFLLKRMAKSAES